MATQSKHGAVLLQCHFRSFFPWIWTLAGVVLVPATSLMLLASGPGHRRTTGEVLELIVGLVFGVSMLVVGLREFRKPTLLFAVTDRGVLVRPIGSTWVRKEIFVPWERVVAMRYMDWGDPDFRLVRSGLSVSRATPAIALKVRMDSTWPPEGMVKRPSWAEIQDEIYVDAWDGSTNSKQVFRQMEEIRARYFDGVASGS